MTQFSSALAHARGGNLRPYCFLTLAFLLMALNVGIAALGSAGMGIFNYLPPLFVALGILTSVRGRNNAELPIGKSYRNNNLCTQALGTFYPQNQIFHVGRTNFCI